MVLQYDKAVMLPDEWDNLTADNLYMKREFLSFMERVNPCDQKYYVVTDETGNLRTIFMTFIKTDYNMLMFTNISISIRITMIYVPLSVTRPGIIYDEYIGEALNFIRSIKGYKIMLNIGDEQFAGFAKGLTCPKCILNLRWDSFNGYMSDLRSGYRYRYKKAFEHSDSLRMRWIDNKMEFTDEMYQTYLQVYNHSKLRIEKLSKEFFMGDFFKIFVFEDDSSVKGFIQLLENGTELIFEFVGIDYKANEKYDTYHRMLLEIINYGISNGFKTIDFGQTADDTKLKLGCEYIYLWAYIHHSNPIINKICMIAADKIQYKPIKTNFRIFK